MRNVNLRLMKLISMVLCCGALVAQLSADETGFKSIFDGKTLNGWEGNPKFWRVEDGAITGQTTRDNPTRGNTFLIWRGGNVEDFELRLKFRIVGGNSGIQYRSRELDNWVVSGYQADIDASGRYAGILYEEKARGILAQRGKKVVATADGKLSEVGTTGSTADLANILNKEGWNDYHVIAKGNHLVQILNGRTTIQFTDNQVGKRAMSGILALQLHAGPPMLIQFKDIRLKNLSANAASTDESSTKKVVFVAGRRSHGYGSHEHKAGCLLLAKLLQKSVPGIETAVFQNGWPSDPETAFEGADAIVMYCDGGSRHMVNPHLVAVDELMKQGVGLACIHYAVEVEKGKPGDAFLDWIGGYFEMDWSVNPHWTAEFKQLPDHPITRGVESFSVHDEWYFHMRFRDQMKGVTPILTAIAPDSTMSRRDGPHSGNPAVRKAVAARIPQHVAWAAEREDGGRGFGFTGGHYHWNWGDDNFRKIVLNAIVWIAKGKVPDNGVTTQTPSRAQLEENQDYSKPERRS